MVRLGDFVSVAGKQWVVSAIYGRAPYDWAWLVNRANKNDQCRLSCRSEAFNG